MDKLEFWRVRESKQVIEFSPKQELWNVALEEELQKIFAYYFFQSKAHVQIDLQKLASLPIPALLLLCNFAYDLQQKKRVLLLQSIPYPAYHYLERFGLLKTFFQAEQAVRPLKPPTIPRIELEVDPQLTQQQK